MFPKRAKFRPKPVHDVFVNSRTNASAWTVLVDADIVVPSISTIHLLTLALYLFANITKLKALPLSVQPILFPVNSIADIERTIEAFAEQPNAGIFFPPDLTTVALRDQAALAAPAKCDRSSQLRDTNWCCARWGGGHQ
jgi:hypothetical protein